MQTAVATCDSLSVFMREMEKHPLLSKEEEYVLAVRYYENEDLEAANKLVVSNLRFVVRIASEYRSYGFPISLGIETLGGVMTTIIERNMTIPSKKAKFSPLRRTTRTRLRSTCCREKGRRLPTTGRLPSSFCRAFPRMQQNRVDGVLYIRTDCILLTYYGCIILHLESDHLDYLMTRNGLKQAY